MNPLIMSEFIKKMIDITWPVSSKLLITKRTDLVDTVTFLYYPLGVETKLSEMRIFYTNNSKTLIRQIVRDL